MGLYDSSIIYYGFTIDPTTKDVLNNTNLSDELKSYIHNVASDHWIVANPNNIIKTSLVFTLWVKTQNVVTWSDVKLHLNESTEYENALQVSSQTQNALISILECYENKDVTPSWWILTTTSSTLDGHLITFATCKLPIQ